MKVTEFSSDFWQVEDGMKWYTVKFRGALGPHIENHKGIHVQPHGVIGKKLLKAIADARLQSVLGSVTLES